MSSSAGVPRHTSDSGNTNAQEAAGKIIGAPPRAEVARAAEARRTLGEVGVERMLLHSVHTANLEETVIEEGVRSVDNTEEVAAAGIEADDTIPEDVAEPNARDRWAHSLSKKCRLELDQVRIGAALAREAEEAGNAAGSADPQQARRREIYHEARDYFFYNWEAQRKGLHHDVRDGPPKKWMQKAVEGYEEKLEMIVENQVEKIEVLRGQLARNSGLLRSVVKRREFMQRYWDNIDDEVDNEDFSDSSRERSFRRKQHLGAVKEASRSSGHDPWATLRFPMLPDPKNFGTDSESSWAGYVQETVQRPEASGPSGSAVTMLNEMTAQIERTMASRAEARAEANRSSPRIRQASRSRSPSQGWHTDFGA